jgi:ribonucleotide reductase beta subunit family protein with ferritin-like domain
MISVDNGRYGVLINTMDAEKYIDVKMMNVTTGSIFSYSRFIVPYTFSLRIWRFPQYHIHSL